MSAQVQIQTRPSDSRRRALKEADSLGGGTKQGVPLVSNFIPIDRYYDAAEKVLVSFHRAFDQKNLDDAYVLGLRFTYFCIDLLPQHNYYKAPKYAKLREKNRVQLDDAIVKLEQVAVLMDLEELSRIQGMERKEEELKHQEEQRRRRIEEEQQRLYDQFEKQRTSVEASASGLTVRESALDKPNHQSVLDKLSLSNGESSKAPVEEKERHHNKRDSDAHGWVFVESEHQDSSARTKSQANLQPSSSVLPLLPTPAAPEGEIVCLPTPLPPPVLPPARLPAAAVPVDTTNGLPPPPSYDMISKTKPQAQTFPPSYQEAWKGASAKRVQSKFTFPPAPQHMPAYANRDLERERERVRQGRKVTWTARQLKEKASNDYRALKSSGRIEVLPIHTYQGRFSHSTNGCAVISPLVVSRHLDNADGVSNADIGDVIDNQCGPLLREVRGKLELDSHALMIPSDVHDFLTDKKFLNQNGFIGVTGGNIMNQKHIGEFIRLLAFGETSSHKELKTGGVLFFREHVITVIKTPIGRGMCSYDLIDSMPGCPDGSCKQMATRTRCKDLVAFQTFLRYYSCSKFSESNLKFMDTNDWDDSMADFDPRVFQGHVWGQSVPQ